MPCEVLPLSVTAVLVSVVALDVSSAIPAEGTASDKAAPRSRSHVTSLSSPTGYSMDISRFMEPAPPEWIEADRIFLLLLRPPAHPRAVQGVLLRGNCPPSIRCSPSSRSR